VNDQAGFRRGVLLRRGRRVDLRRSLGLVLLVGLAAACSGGSSQGDAFKDLRSAPYLAGSGFSTDGTRVIDLMRIQASLQKYRAAKARYPSSLNDLLPTYAPLGHGGEPLNAIPADPQSHQPYSYHVHSDGLDYDLSATLSNGRAFTGFPHLSRLR
jgi:hypothetical protein